MNNDFELYEAREGSNFYDMLKDLYTIYKDNVAVRYRKENNINKISFNDLISNICSMYNYYIENNIENLNIGIISENRYEYIVTYLSSVFSNVIAPLDKNLPREDLFKIIKEFDIKVLFYTDKTKNKLENLSTDIKIINIDEEFNNIISKKFDRNDHAHS